MPTTAYTKPFLTYSQQLDLLETRGLTINDRTDALVHLKEINYYRLSAYSLTLRKHDVFNAGTSFDDIVYLYLFDDQLRDIILHFVFDVEHSIRAFLSHHHAKTYGSLGYLNNQNFRNELHHASFLNRLHHKLEVSYEPAIAHHRTALKGVYPFWVAVEAMSFDMVSMFYKNMRTSDQKSLSDEYYGNKNLYNHIGNWLHCCVDIRNIAAHGARFYNRILPNKVLYKHGDVGKFRNDTPFASFYALLNLLPSIDQKTAFVDSLAQLLSTFPKAEINELGFPKNWAGILI